MKLCCTCRELLPDEMFSKNKSTLDGLSRNCRKCKSEQAAKERSRHKDRIVKTNKLYYDDNRDKIKEADHEYYLKHKKEISVKVSFYVKTNRAKHNAWCRKAKNKNKAEVFSHYCGGSEPKCQRCGETDIEILTIDHINGKGGEHRREIGLGKSCGSRFYFWLKRNNYPDGFQVLCFNCQFRKRLVEIRPENPTHLQQVRAKYVRSIKLECLDHYGGRVCPCGETDIDTLTLDHINDDGAEDRRETGRQGFGWYINLRKHDFPNDPPLQVLCLNCQIKKRQRKYEKGKNR